MDRLWAIFERLRRVNREKGSRLVLVYLPMHQEVAPAVSDSWRYFLRQQAEERRIPFLDTMEESRRLPPGQIPALFIPEGVLTFPASANHCSVAGNQGVARQL